MYLNRTYAVRHLIEAIEREQPAINLEHMIDMQGAIQALGGGIPMSAIIRDARETLERRLIQCVLTSTQGNKAEAARRLRVDSKNAVSQTEKKYTFHGNLTGLRS